MTERDLSAALFLRDVVDDAAPQTRADRAEGLAFGHEPLDDGVSVALDDVIGDAARGEIIGQHVSRKVRLLLIEIEGEQIEVDGGALSDV